jgi:DNA/RNA-binding domain of Phe-tRNA-synthetase-like protein
MEFRISSGLKKRFPGLKVIIFQRRDIIIKKKKSELEEFKREVIEETRQKYNLENLKDISIFRAYRTFFWKIGIDPTKSRPASEALIRRILLGKSIPNINTFVDAYNLASIKSEVALAAFDKDRIVGELIMRFAHKGEEFLGIGMKKTVKLEGSEVIILDSNKPVALYPHRDADFTKITEKTRNIFMLSCGVPGISLKTLQTSKEIALNYINRFCQD